MFTLIVLRLCQFLFAMSPIIRKEFKSLLLQFQTVVSIETRKAPRIKES